jgi:hypothetical protein
MYAIGEDVAGFLEVAMLIDLETVFTILSDKYVLLKCSKRQKCFAVIWPSCGGMRVIQLSVRLVGLSQSALPGLPCLLA